MNQDYVKYLLEQTRQNYNLLAKDYARTRAYIPEDIRKLGNYTLSGDKVLDSGCANGRFFEVIKDKKTEYFGVDISEQLIDIAKKNYPEAKFQAADSLNLPFPEYFFDKVYSISVIHHIPSKGLRLQYLKEAKRVLKKEGFLVLRAWDFWQRKLPLILILKYAFLKIIGRSRLDFKDIFLPWNDSKGGVLAQRYFHCFTKRELENLAKKAGFKIKKIWRDGSGQRANIYLVAER